MTDPIIKAPLPPDMNETHFSQKEPTAPSIQTETPEEKTMEQLTQNQSSDISQPAWKKNLQDLKEKAIPYFWYVIGGTFFVGILFGIILFGGSSEPPSDTKTQTKLPIVSNDDIRRPLKPCGVAANNEYCFLYLMNTYPAQRKVDDFIQRAYEMTGRHPYEIRPENPSYVQTFIPSGFLMKIIIPPAR